MLNYNQKETNILSVGTEDVYCFEGLGENIDAATVKSFGEEWGKFAEFSDEEISKIGDEYFDITSAQHFDQNSVVLDVGCGSGRWSKYIAPRVKAVEAIDPSDAIVGATKLLASEKNVRTTMAGVDNIPFSESSFDFVFSLGVLHHIPDTQKALNKVVKQAKINGHVLIYLYYNLDNRGIVYKTIFKLSTFLRYIVSAMPKGLKHFTCDVIAVFIYWPLITLASIVKGVFTGKEWYKKIPLSYYVGKSFKVVRNDALDRFGTPLEQRFSRVNIQDMMEKAGLSEIKFSERMPCWHAVGKRIK